MNTDPLGLGGFRNVAQPQAATKKSKNFFQDNISTLGSVGGSLGGAALGASVGSIVPGVGTAIGGLLGALLGGAGGGAVGQVAENATMGDNLGTDVGSEALWGGLTALPFGATGKLIKAGGTLAKGLGSDAAKVTARDLVQQAGVKTIPRATLSSLAGKGTLDQAITSAMDKTAATSAITQKLGTKLSGTADNLAVKQFRLTPSQLSNYSKKFGEDAGQTIRKYGLSSTEDITTKGIEPLQSQFNSLVSGVGTIPTETLKKNFDSVVKTLSNSASTDMKSVGKNVSSEAQNILKKYGNTIDANELNSIRREFDSLVNYTQSVANPARYSVNKRVADVLRKTLQESDLTGQLKNVGQEISKLRQLSDVVAKQANNGRGSSPVSMLNLLGGAMGGGAGGVPGMLAGVGATALVNSPAGRRALMTGTEKLTQKLSSVAPSVGQTLPQAITRVGGLGALRNNGENQSSDLNNAGNTNASMTAITTPSTVQNMNTSYTNTPQVSNPFGVSADEIGMALMRAYAAGDSNGVEQLKGMYDIASQYETAASKKAQAANDGYSKPSASQYAQGVTAMQSIDSLEGLLGSNPNLVNANATPGQDIPILGGLVSNVAGTGQYRALTKNILNSIARINTGANMPESEQAFYEQTYLPQPGNSPAVIQQKINNLRQFFSPIVNYGGGSSTSDLVNALMQAQNSY